MGMCHGKSAKCANASTPIHTEDKLGVRSHSDTSNSRSSGSSFSLASSQASSASSYKSSHAVSLRSFSLADLKAATRNFRSDTLLGEGGFGFVYKGWIDMNTFAPSKPGSGIVVAIKKLKRESYQGHKEWLAEVTYLGQLQHPNLVKLIGYCSEADHKLLVYEFLQKGSLENHLFKRCVQPLSWATRFEIAIGVARGLAFLHSLETQVIFRDLKASNILLDSDYSPKLSDFGLARNGPTGDNTHVSTRVIGTRGYAAPEYIATGHLSAKCDVYTFGVVLLELMTGKRALNEGRGGVEEALVEWVMPFLEDKRKILRIMDTKLGGQYAKKEAQAMAAVALQCLQIDPKSRPDMAEILPSIEGLQGPKQGTRSSK